MRCAPLTKSKKRSDGPVDGPVGSQVSAGPSCPEWLKYGPIERITGVLASGGRLLGRRLSAWSVTPSVEGIEACVHVASGGTSAARAAAGTRASAASARAVARVLMRTATQSEAEACFHKFSRTRA